MVKIEALEDAIEKKSKVGIYSVFYTIAHGDPNFSSGKFMETLEYVNSKNIDGFMQEFDNDEFEPEDKWNEDYWALIASSLIDNFCMERIEHLKQIGQKVYPVKKEESSNISTEHTSRGRNVPDSHKTGQRKNNVEQPQYTKPTISQEKKQSIREKHKQRVQEGRGVLNKLFDVFGFGGKR
ncbi:hypothetical protein [uncultured Clostridium sp.]|uniref:hypothetical protein n=1 Tax=uncultured Clostridium sp. TaxID=59620 RepID=UPI0025DE5838|nr:hypothetical protein [uncultured Clostridium sp.]